MKMHWQGMNEINELKSCLFISTKRLDPFCEATDVKILGVSVLAVIRFSVSALELISMCQPSLWLPLASKSMPLQRQADTVPCSVLRVVG